MPTDDTADLGTAELALLSAARETGLLEALLREAGTAREAAAAADVTDRAARVVVECLVDLGFFERVGDEVEPTDRALGFLATRDVRSVGTLPLALDRFDAYRSLPETMATGTPPAPNDEATRHDLGARAAVDDGTVRGVADAVHGGAPDATEALELSGAPGRYATELAGRGLDVTLLDAPEALDLVEPTLDSDDVSVHAGSLATVPAGEYDVVYAVDVAWTLSGSENRVLVEAAERALADGGSFVLVEPLRDHSAAAVETAVRALATGEGECWSEAEVVGWCSDAGLDAVEVTDVPGTPFQAVAARREDR